ncbi:MAG: ATP phosphoribosyltransferase regulatory subunit [Nitrospiria bacterium]
MIPKGVSALLREGTFRRRAIERQVLSSLDAWGYQEVIPPIFEFLDVFSLGVDEDRLENAYKFVDRATGRIMVLRPDVTPQIARIAATLLRDQARPLRLCYSANVFRHSEEHAGRERELFQIGGELIGPTDAEADAEIIALTIEILLRIGLKSFRVAIGQMEFTRGLLSPFGSSPLLFRKILNFVAKKEASQLERLLLEENVDAASRRQVLSLLDLLGGETLLKHAQKLSGHPACRSGLKRLRDVYDILQSAGYENYLLIDLGEVRGFNYYTGTIFEIFAEGLGSELGGGGRYDHLLGKFGAPSASTGFAFNIDRLQSVINASMPEETFSWVDIAVFYLAKDGARAIALTSKLREAGFRVTRHRCLKGQGIDSFCAEARRQKIKKILLMEGRQQDALRLIDPNTGAEALQDREDALAWLRLNTAV